MKQMIVSYASKEIQMALLDRGQLVEFASERSSGKGIAGNFYKGKVMNVLPGIQAAFVDIGQKKNGFLYIDDVLHPHMDKQPSIKPNIADLISAGQEIIVQVAKEPVGTKGAKLTTHYSLPGRWVVYMPEADYIAVSKKISTDEERLRLRRLGEELRKGEEGLILRTVSEGEPTEAIAADIRQLRETWKRIISRAGQSAPPIELHRDLGIVERMIRDVFNPEEDRFITDHTESAQQASEFIRTLVLPGTPVPVELYSGQEPLFQHMGVQERLYRDFQRKIWLENGSHIIWDQTEALTVIDVNTGKFTGGATLEETVTHTNIQAGEEIARLLRLRDTGGIIIIDFIDMDSESGREAVVEAMENVLYKDRTKTHIVGWTRLGMLELTRKKAREETGSMSYKTCSVCHGTGKIASRIKD
ncbi:Rne/Rng family ribonuclease [Paenibacillus wulumuqiensis]|uniref:Rne/Rng family ribonuclease n=1 Tax=Paenibacillus wulumuqiensis TaxID=1567107 RepID=UPI0006196EFF|nr:Rne/Rng family ribonuclease [Paenibacillus wulumuqiensis]